MPYRDLSKTELKLKNNELIFRLALNKSFAPNPAYWIEVYKLISSDVFIYTIARQWNFTRKKEEVSGESISRKFTTLQQTIGTLDSIINKKVFQDKWIIHNVWISQNIYEHDHFSDWIKIIQNSKDKVITENPIKKLSLSDRFYELQKKRKRKAEW